MFILIFQLRTEAKAKNLKVVCITLQNLVLHILRAFYPSDPSAVIRMIDLI